jgi:hypothetical protein
MKDRNPRGCGVVGGSGRQQDLGGGVLGGEAVQEAGSAVESGRADVLGDSDVRVVRVVERDGDRAGAQQRRKGSALLRSGFDGSEHHIGDRPERPGLTQPHPDRRCRGRGFDDVAREILEVVACNPGRRDEGNVRVDHAA